MPCSSDYLYAIPTNNTSVTHVNITTIKLKQQVLTENLIWHLVYCNLVPSSLFLSSFSNKMSFVFALKVVLLLVQPTVTKMF